ncbi:MAG TPA: hypothetical protein VGH56_09295, partial [Solirubrobacteraceae bacterium]
MHQVGAGHQRHPRRVLHAANLDRPLDHPRLGFGEDGPQAHDLLDARRQIRIILALVELFHQSAPHTRLARQSLERPRQLRGGRLVARDERGHQLVAQLLRAHRRTVLVACAQQHPEHITATVIPILAAFAPALLDQSEQL